jgi:hypothetical protein
LTTSAALALVVAAVLVIFAVTLHRRRHTAESTKWAARDTTAAMPLSAAALGGGHGDAVVSML